MISRLCARLLLINRHRTVARAAGWKYIQTGGSPFRRGAASVFDVFKPLRLALSEKQIPQAVENFEKQK